MRFSTSGNSNDPLSWFEGSAALQGQKNDSLGLDGNPFLVEWIENKHTGRALVVGSGLGDAAFLYEKDESYSIRRIRVSSGMGKSIALRKDWLIWWRPCSTRRGGRGPSIWSLRYIFYKQFPKKSETAPTKTISLLDRHGLLMCIGRLAKGLEEENDLRLAAVWDFIHQIERAYRK